MNILLMISHDHDQLIDSFQVRPILRKAIIVNNYFFSFYRELLIGMIEKRLEIILKYMIGISSLQ